ncbi:MAG: preprotein translocase subunit YajC [Acidobacteria bacterium]|nr:preprotein translocase subunit YajC [Acidobacteriota bacterium]
MFYFLTAGAPEQSPLMMLMPMVIIALIFYFLLIRPMRKRQKQTEQMISDLKNGDRVITSGGIYGTVSGLREKTLILKIADNVKIEVAKTAVAGLQSSPPEETK